MLKHDQWEWSAYLLFWQKQIVVSVQQCRPVILNESIGNQYPLRIHLKTWDTEALTKERPLRFLTRGRLSGFSLLQWLMSLSLFLPRSHQYKLQKSLYFSWRHSFTGAILLSWTHFCFSVALLQEAGFASLSGVSQSAGLPSVICQPSLLTQEVFIDMYVHIHMAS